MTASLEALHTVAELDALLDASYRQPVVLFKHSNRCEASTAAATEFESYLAAADERLRHGMVVVQEARSVSDAIAARLGVRHETPQVLVVRAGRVLWHASHWRVTAASLAAAAASALAPDTAG